MKRLLYLLLAACLCTGGMAQTIIVDDDTIAKNDTTVTSITADEDSIVGVSYQSGSMVRDLTELVRELSELTGDEGVVAPVEEMTGKITDGIAKAIAMVCVIAIIFVFGVLALLIILYFRYKNRKAKYAAAAKLAEEGQPVPSEVRAELASVPQQGTEDLYTRGIKNVFLGLGLGIFLYALSGEFWMGAIGGIVLCNGLGQLVIARRREMKALLGQSAAAPAQVEAPKEPAPKDNADEPTKTQA